MRIGRPNLGIYLRAIPLFVVHPSIAVAPLLAACAAVALNLLGEWLTDPIGGVGSGLYAFLGSIAVLTAFGVAIVQARDVLRGYRGTFEDAWSEARRKLGGIAIAAFGFAFFVGAVANLAGGILASLSPYFWIFAPATVLFVTYLCIYMMPAASIGGNPGVASLQRSYRLALADPFPAMVLTAAWWLATSFVPHRLGVLYALLPDVAAQFAVAFVIAILLAYLAFAFAAQYEDVA